MADVITRFRLETTQYDSKLRDAAKGLKEVVRVAELGGKDFKNFSDKAIENARALGQTASGATNAKDRLKDLVGSFNEAAKAYNNLSQTQQQSDFGKALSQSLEQLQQRIKQTKDELYGLGDAVSSKGGGLFSGDKLSGMLQVFGGNLMTKGAGMAMSFVGEMGDMVRQGIELAKTGEGIRIAFERLGRGDILQGLREATHGTVTDLELMKAAVQFNDFKLPVEELGTMLAFAQQKAKDTGQSVEYMTQSIVTGLGRKSLMILDNLGLSASEIKEKMKETGDMTKAVGEIIREQMAKAGDYVETAADRATQANVSLQNKMEELGRKFAPVEEASNQLWTSMKIGILDVVGGPLARLLNSLTEAGRLKNALSDNNGEQGSGNTKVNQQLNKLRGSNYKQFYYNKVVENYTKQINDLQAQINNGGKKPGAGSGTSQDVRYLTAQKQSLEVMRGLFKSGAKDIMQPVKVDIKTDEAEQNITSLTNKLKDLQAQRKKAIAAGDTDLSKNLLKQINQVKADIKGLGGSTTTTTKQPKTEVELNQAKIKELTQEYIKLGDQETEASKNRQIEIQKEIELLQNRNNLLGVRAEQAQGKFLGGDVQTTGLSTSGYIIDRSRLFDTEGGIGWQKLQKYNDQISVLEYKRRQKEKENESKTDVKDDNEFLNDFNKIVGNVGNITTGLQTLGVDLPEGFTKTIAAIQTISGILSAILTITTVISAATQADATASWLDAIIPFAHGGKVPHAATGYYVPGTRYSGDVTPILANAGELVLNKSSQSNLAADLQHAESLVKMLDSYQASFLFRSQMGSDVSFSGGLMQNLQLSTVITGEQLRLVLNNNGRRTGRGEYVTTNFR